MYPIELLQAKCFKLTLPINGAQEIKIPKLATYESEYFRLNEAGDGIVMTAPCTGDTTANSSNPRSELREMSADGLSNANWSSTTGVHAMEFVAAVTVMAEAKPVVIVGQIHDAADDITVFRFERNPDKATCTLWITDGNTSHGYKVMDNYKIGEKIKLGFGVRRGVVGYFVNGQQVNYAQAKTFSGAYFKVGCYNQCHQGTDYAQVVLYGAAIVHDGVTMGYLPDEPQQPPVVEPPPTPPDPTPTDPPTPPDPPLDIAQELQYLRHEAATVVLLIDGLLFRMGAKTL